MTTSQAATASGTVPAARAAPNAPASRSPAPRIRWAPRPASTSTFRAPTSRSLRSGVVAPGVYSAQASRLTLGHGVVDAGLTAAVMTGASRRLRPPRRLAPGPPSPPATCRHARQPVDPPARGEGRGTYGVPEVCLVCELQRWVRASRWQDDRPCPSVCSISSSRGCAVGWFCSVVRRRPRTRSCSCCGTRSPCCGAPVLRLRRVGPDSYRPAIAARSPTTSPADSTRTCSPATPDSALAACTHLTVRSRFSSTIRRVNSR